MKPTLDEEITEIAESCIGKISVIDDRTTSAELADVLSIIESAIRAGIEAWKRQEPSNEMIDAAQRSINCMCFGRIAYRAMMSASLRTSAFSPPATT